MFMAKFQYLMKLHYSQTLFRQMRQSRKFQYLMKLHYSQTRAELCECMTSFSTL